MLFLFITILYALELKFWTAMLNLVIDASSLRGGLPVNEVTQIFKEKLGMDIESFNPQTYGFYDVTCLFKYLQSIRMCKLKGN